MQDPKTPPELRPPHREDPNPNPGDPNPDPGDPNPDPGDPNPDPGDPNPELRSETLYSGASLRGDISEALEAAILSAKESIPSSLVKWELVSIQGESGGFVEVNTITVSIRAATPST
ncbi:MAG: hypothetical protein JJE30_00855 [Desulfuromonadales bacterium]|nr:hypothetical protein [Desulfuromonadales bacterium]